jgi:hypothetical protein
MRRERYLGVTAGGAGQASFRGRFFGMRVSRLNGGTVTIRVDNGLPQDFDAPGFLPTTEADRPADRIEVSGGAACLIEVAETFQEALMLIATPPAEAAAAHHLDVRTYAAGFDFFNAYAAQRFARPAWARRATLWAYAKVGDNFLVRAPTVIPTRPLPAGAGGGDVFAAVNSIALVDGGATPAYRGAATLVATWGDSGAAVSGVQGTPPICYPGPPPPEIVAVTNNAAGACVVSPGKTYPIWVEWGD